MYVVSSEKIALSINLNKIALLRNSREGNFPNVVTYAEKGIDLGVQGITVHPRPDQRHIRPGDVRALSKMCKQRNVEFNVEGNPLAPANGSYPGLEALVAETLPTQCTLVPDSDQQLTSDHGFDLGAQGTHIEPIIRRLKDLGIRVSLFMDPDVHQIQLAKEVGADRIELYTGPFAWAHAKDEAKGLAEFEQHCEAAKAAQAAGLGVNAGHDLNLTNMKVYRNLPHLSEVSIGHALTVDALNLGFDAAIKAYLDVCS